MTDEKTCTRCNESWPKDTEFFRRENRGSMCWVPWCRACEADQKREKRAAERALTGDLEWLT